MYAFSGPVACGFVDIVLCDERKSGTDRTYGTYMTYKPLLMSPIRHISPIHGATPQPFSTRSAGTPRPEKKARTAFAVRVLS